MNKRINGTYYTENEFIVKYMVKKINPHYNDIILEPSAGIGHFIDEIILNHNYKEIVLYEFEEVVEEILQRKFENNNIHINIADTLIDETLQLYASSGGYFDKIIGNPPYGAYQTIEKRKLLKKYYPNLYVKETYSLFLYLSLLLLKEKGILSFIIPDTFLSLNRHKYLREFLLKNYSILEILRLPTKIFKTVKFQYSNLVIITIKRERNINNKINVIDGFSTEKDFMYYVNGKNNNIQTEKILQSDILNNTNFSFMLTKNKNISKIIAKSKIKLGDIADIKTGFYSGNDKKFMKLHEGYITNNRNKLEKINDDEINYTHKSLQPIEGEKTYIPILKGVSQPFFNDMTHFINWDENSLNFYKNDKKSRFQNSSFYFKKGIGVPMVKSKKIKATIFEGVVFDQSIVGLFPKKQEYFNFILILINSSLGNELIHTINHTANNSANYLKEIPIFIPNERQLNIINQLVSKLKDKNFDGKIQDEIDNIIEDIYSGI